MASETLPALLCWPGWLESHAGCCARRLFSVPNLDWTVEAGGYRLVIENGAMTGLAFDEAVSTEIIGTGPARFTGFPGSLGNA